jgi:hypothetical protein
MRRFGSLVLLASFTATGCFGSDNPADPVVEIGAIEELPVVEIGAIEELEELPAEDQLPDLVPLQDEELEELPADDQLPDLVPLPDEELPPLVPLESDDDPGLTGDFCQDWLVVQGQTFSNVNMAAALSADPENPAWWTAIQGLWEAQAQQADWVSTAAPKNETEVIANAEALAEAIRSLIPLLTKESHQQVDGSELEFHYPIVYKYVLERCATWLGGDLSIDEFFDGSFSFD